MVTPCECYFPLRHSSRAGKGGSGLFDAPPEACVYDLILKGTPYESHNTSV